MNLQALLTKLNQIEEGTLEGYPPMQSMPSKPEPPAPTMSVNLNAQGLDNIEDVLMLMQKLKGDEPKALSTPPLKMLPDFDADNDDKVGGEMDFELPPMHDKDHMIVKTLDKDGDLDHDMDDHKEEAWENEPDEEDMDVDYILNKVSGGMNRKQGTYPKVATGDNPMQNITSENRVELVKQDLYNSLKEFKGAK